MKNLRDMGREKLAGEVADKKEIDWSQMQEHDAFARNLRGIERLSHVFQNLSSPETVPSEDPFSELSSPRDESCLFTWGHLKVLEKIGEGSYGEVYRAFDTVLERDVALKVRSSSATHVKDWAFIHEARRIARVRHPNVLAIHGADVLDGRVAIWTDLIEGVTLKEKIEASKPCLEECALEYVIPLIRAIQAVHNNGLVHGDIKTANVMVESDGRVILMDFGAGSLQKESKGPHLATGTPLYMAPELFHGEPGSTASDVYSFGVLLFNLLTNGFPLEGNTLPELIYLHETECLASVSSVRKGLSRDWVELIESCLSKPENRPDAETILEKLLWIQSSPRRKTKRRMYAGLISILLLGILFTSFGFFRARKEAVKARRSMHQSEEIKDFLLDMISAPEPGREGRDVKVMEILDSAKPRLEKELVDQPHIQAMILNTIGKTYMNLGAYEKAMPLFKQVEERALKIHLEKVVVLQSRFLQSECLSLQGKTVEAVALGHKCLEECLLHLGKGHSVTFQTATGLAISLCKLGQLDEAETRINEALQWDSEANEKMVFRARLQLGHIYSSQSKYQKAEEIFKELLVLHKKNFKEDRAQSVVIRSSLVMALSLLGKLEEALPLQRECLKASKDVYGEDHVATLSNQLNYCVLLKQLGKYEECLDCLDLYIHKTEQVFGPEHAYTLMGQSNRAGTLFSLGLFSEAVAANQRILTSQVRSLGRKNPGTLLTTINLAEALNESGSPKEAEALLVDYRPVLEEVLGEEHHFSLEAKDLVGQSYYFQSRFREAREIHQWVLASKIKILGADSIYCFNTRQRLALAEWKMGNREIAETHMQDLLKLLEKQLGTRHPDYHAAEEILLRIQER